MSHSRVLQAWDRDTKVYGSKLAGEVSSTPKSAAFSAGKPQIEIMVLHPYLSCYDASSPGEAHDRYKEN
jgi:hypothetical protein